MQIWKIAGDAVRLGSARVSVTAANRNLTIGERALRSAEAVERALENVPLKTKLVQPMPGSPMPLPPEMPRERITNLTTGPTGVPRKCPDGTFTLKRSGSHNNLECGETLPASPPKHEKKKQVPQPVGQPQPLRSENSKATTMLSTGSPCPRDDEFMRRMSERPVRGSVNVAIQTQVTAEPIPDAFWDKVLSPPAHIHYYVNSDGVLTWYGPDGVHHHHKGLAIPDHIRPKLRHAGGYGAAPDGWAHVTAANRWYINTNGFLTQYDPDGRNHRHYGHVSTLPAFVQARIPRA